jgi:hypothetical protein
MLGMHHERYAEGGEDRKGLAEVVLVDVGELVNPRVHEEALEGEHASGSEPHELVRVPGDHAADEADVDGAFPASRVTLRDQAGRRSRGGHGVERHVEQRRHTAGGRGARAGLESLPVRASWLIEVYVRVHEPRHDHEVAGVLDRRATRHVFPARHPTNDAVAYIDGRGTHSLRRHHAS